MMLERVTILVSSGKFETAYQQYSVDTALHAFRDQVRGDIHIWKAV